MYSLIDVTDGRHMHVHINDCALFHSPEIDGTKMKLPKGVIFIFLALIFKVS